MQLVLRMQSYDWEKKKWKDAPERKHVVALWQMERVKRMEVWRELVMGEKLEELVLDGVSRVKCPLDLEELSMLLPEGEDALQEMRVLVLTCTKNLTDEALRWLSDRGCGGNLTHMIFWSLCSLSLSLSLFSLMCGRLVHLDFCVHHCRVVVIGHSFFHSSFGCRTGWNF